MSDVMLFKLSTSEEILAKINDETETHYVLDRPRLLAPMQQHNNQVSLALIPWLMGAQDPRTEFESAITLNKSAIIGKASELPKALVDMYLSKTSGISLIAG